MKEISLRKLILAHFAQQTEGCNDPCSMPWREAAVALVAVIVAFVFGHVRALEERLVKAESRADEFERRVLEKLDLRERSAELRLAEAERMYEHRATASEQAVKEEIAATLQAQESTRASLEALGTSSTASVNKHVDSARKKFREDLRATKKDMEATLARSRKEIEARVDLSEKKLVELQRFAMPKHAGVDYAQARAAGLTSVAWL